MRIALTLVVATAAAIVIAATTAASHGIHHHHIGCCVRVRVVVDDGQMIELSLLAAYLQVLFEARLHELLQHDLLLRVQARRLNQVEILFDVQVAFVQLLFVVVGQSSEDLICAVDKLAGVVLTFWGQRVDRYGEERELSRVHERPVMVILEAG